jgi:CDP-glycerol glycerophosphotransferase
VDNLDKYNFPPGIKTVKYNSIKSIFFQVTAKIWIDNTRKEHFVRKREKQFYIQTWHGCIGLKKSEKDSEITLSRVYIKQAKNDSKMINAMISNSNYCTNMYRNSFWYNGEILEYGSPRNDILIKYPASAREKIYKIYNIEPKFKIIIYAPTFRDNPDRETYNIAFKSILQSLNENTSCRWLFFLRLHPNLKPDSTKFPFSPDIINVSSYDDMQELLIASDILITDFSSSMFEFMLMKKPVFLFLNDYDAYINKERGLYFDILSLPFPHAFNNDKLLDNIKNYNRELYIKKLNLFIDQFNLFETGNASEKVVDRILSV